MREIEYRLSPPLTDEQLNALFGASWPAHVDQSFASVLGHSLVYVGAFEEERLIGYVNVAWDGSVHGFLLEPTVLPSHRRRGIGRELVRQAAEAAKGRGMHWLHVDYEPHLEPFYRSCGFRPTDAGLIRLNS